MNLKETKFNHIGLIPINWDVVRLKDIAQINKGSVFDEKKNRVGYGGGFYDRYFEKRKDICRIAAAYEMQIVEEIETEEFDLPADYVTTEERFW